MRWSPAGARYLAIFVQDTTAVRQAQAVRDKVIVAETTESAAKWGRVRWDVEQIEQAADQAKRLIKHLLAFARREEAEPVLVDIGQTISDAAGFLSEVLGEHVPVITAPAEGLWPACSGTRRRPPTCC